MHYFWCWLWVKIVKHDIKLGEFLTQYVLDGVMQNRCRKCLCCGEKL